MNLYDKLPAEDKQLIKDYLSKYTKIDEIPNLENTLQEWSKNKRTLYRAFGNQFRITVPIKAIPDKAELCQNLQNKYNFPYSYYYCEDFLSSDNKSHIFIIQLLEHFAELKRKSDMSFDMVIYHIAENMKNILSWRNLLQGHVDYFRYDTITYKNTTLKFNAGVKPLRILRKTLNFIEFPHMESFEKFCNDISYELTNTKNTTTNLVFSIHPIDFMTMSHNTCNWTSCMNWDSGCYSNGTIEMMNSNMAIVAYVESSDQDFTINGRNIPNKSWRCLYYLHKDIICSGKPYPFYNNNLVRGGLNALANLVKENLNWDYQYKNQQYFDMCNFDSNEDARNYIEPFYPQKHNIILYNYAAMYNDLVHDHDEEYYCYRNWVPRTLKLCVSGPATCVICGKPITTTSEIRNHPDYFDADFLSRGSNKICENCDCKYYSAYMGKFYTKTVLHTCSTVSIWRTYQWNAHEYKYVLEKSNINIPVEDNNSLIMANSHMPQKAKDILADICQVESIENIVFSLTRYSKPDIFRYLSENMDGKDIEEIKQYFSPIGGEYIEQLPISNSVSLS